MRRDERSAVATVHAMSKKPSDGIGDGFPEPDAGTE
jgi:hypothetical protein